MAFLRRYAMRRDGLEALPRDSSPGKRGSGGNSSDYLDTTFSVSET